MTEQSESEQRASGASAAPRASSMAGGGAGSPGGDAAASDRFDLSALFPAKGDPRRPPDWFGRALLYVGIGIFLWLFVRDAWQSVEWIVLDIVISVFLALAMEPIVLVMVRHGWKRGAASIVTMVGLAAVMVGLFTMFGSLLVQQVIGLVYSIPSTYNDLVNFVATRTPWKLPAFNELGSQLYYQLLNGDLLQGFQLSGDGTGKLTDFVTQTLSNTATSIGAFIGSFFLQLMTVVLVTYYVSAAGASMRRAMCKWIRPEGQRRFLVVWTVVQEQISSFLFSRIILAVINAACLSVFMIALHIPNWLPLSIFCGIVSQFIPTIGTYIGGALPVLFALGSNGVWIAVAVLVYIIVYQQIENMILSPIISKRTMDINPAISLLAVFVGGALFGALGAFLALPVAASIQVIFTMNTRQYELIDSPLLDDPKVTRKSKLVEASEAFSENIIKPVSNHLPRAARGTTSRVSTYGSMDMDRIEEELAELYGEGPSPDAGDAGAGAPPLHKPLFAAASRSHDAHAGDGRDGKAGDAGETSRADGEGADRPRRRRGPRPTSAELDVSETIAIPKGVLKVGDAIRGGFAAVGAHGADASDAGSAHEADRESSHDDGRPEERDHHKDDGASHEGAAYDEDDHHDASASDDGVAHRSGHDEDDRHGDSGDASRASARAAHDARDHHKDVAGDRNAAADGADANHAADGSATTAGEREADD